MQNPDELTVIKQKLYELEQAINQNQYEQSSKVAQIAFVDLTGSSPTSDIATAVNEIKAQFNTLVAEMQRINFMQSRG